VSLQDRVKNNLVLWPLGASVTAFGAYEIILGMSKIETIHGDKLADLQAKASASPKVMDYFQRTSQLRDCLCF